MAPIYLFTWNLTGEMDAHDLAVDHLAKQGTGDIFIACLQELPEKSLIAKARYQQKQRKMLDAKGILVVPVAKPRPRGLALVHHPDLKVSPLMADSDGEFLAAVFHPPSSQKTIQVVGLHAKSMVDMQAPEDRGGSRALLRHALNGIVNKE